MLEKRVFKAIAYDALYIFINYVVAYIPFWTVRKLLYIFCGMKIGKRSRINMKCYVYEPWHIRIGERTIINEHCIIDGRGGLDIGDNCSISVYSIIYTASHLADSESFQYYETKTSIGNGVWIGARATILPGAVLNDACIIGANSVAPKGNYDKRTIYAGTPARKIRERKATDIGDLDYCMFFR